MTQYPVNNFQNRPIERCMIIMSRTGGSEFNVDVHSGPNIDIVLVSGHNFQRFKDGGMNCQKVGRTP